MKLSVIIPFYFGVSFKCDLLNRCINSIHGHNELIVVGHNGYNSLPQTINKGIRASEGEYILILSDDMEMIKGSLESLCVPRTVTHPLVNDEPSIFGGAICYPREVIDTIGLYDEKFVPGYFDDDDMIHRVKLAGFDRKVISSVNMSHPEAGFTLNQLSNIDLFNINKNYFESKWGTWKQVDIPEVI